MLHLLLVVFIISAPFTNNEGILLMHAITIPFILLHWVTNDNTCCLTVTEAYFRKGVPKDELFFQKLIGPVYEPRYDIMIIGGMLLLLGITLFKVYNRKERIEKVFKMMYNDVFGDREKNEEKKEDLI